MNIKNDLGLGSVIETAEINIWAYAASGTRSKVDPAFPCWSIVAEAKSAIANRGSSSASITNVLRFLGRNVHLEESGPGLIARNAVAKP